MRISNGRLPCGVTLSFPKLELCGGLAFSGVLGPVTDHRVLLQTQKSPRVVPPRPDGGKTVVMLIEKACFMLFRAYLTTLRPVKRNVAGGPLPEHSLVVLDEWEG